MLKNISPWAAAAVGLFNGEFEPIYSGFEGKVYLQPDALWLIPGPFMASSSLIRLVED